jgi:hypothetical protein
MRCAAIHQALASEGLSATILKSTSPAPTSASVTMKTSEATAALRTGWPFAWTLSPQTHSTTASTSASPLVTRCVYSMSVCTLGESGTTSPWHTGQWSPHPSPERVARTKAPHSTTASV